MCFNLIIRLSFKENIIMMNQFRTKSLDQSKNKLLTVLSPTKKKKDKLSNGSNTSTKEFQISIDRNASNSKISLKKKVVPVFDEGDEQDKDDEADVEVEVDV